MAVEREFLDGRVVVKTGDITAEEADAVVNAANSSLLGGGGVDGAIHRAGGPAILEECKRLRAERYPGGLPTGQAAHTTAGRMPARAVIHTVGPVYRKGDPDMPALLANCYRNSLALAAEHSLSTVAFPAISTGVYGYPKEEAAQVASQAVSNALESLPAIRQVRLVFFSAQDMDAFLRHCVWSREGR